MLRFFTINKKPKLYALLIPTLILVISMVFYYFKTLRPALYAPELLLSKQVRNGEIVMALLIDIYLLIALILLIRAFIRQLKYNPYSYNSIYYIGFAIFTAFIFMTGVVVLIMMITKPDSYSGRSVLSLIYNSARNYMLLTAPFILIFSLLLRLSNAVLLKKEGYSLSNVLGIVLSLFLTIGEIYLFVADMYATGSYYEVMMHDMFVNILSAVYLYFECMLIGTIIVDAITASYEPSYDKDFMIILGCGIREDGTPLPLLQGRIDRALDFANKQKEATGRDLIFILSGGQGPDEIVAEAAAMKNYLLSKGIKEEFIVEEDKSVNTMENMRFSKEKIETINKEGKVAFSTTNYHVFRGGLYARRAGMKAEGIGAKTKWYFWPNAAVREFVGLLTQHRVKQIVILGTMIILYAFMTYLSFK
ncbi:MAG: YdcF family protein [Erysipelotrichaceae bacterium]|nr:YdcF family protein [Erysipelotrichaceae bacterium]